MITIETTASKFRHEVRSFRRARWPALAGIVATLVLLLSFSTQSLALICEDALSSRVASAEYVLKISLTPNQKKAITRAHNVGRGKVGRNGIAAGIHNYSFRQLLRKARILRAAGFSKDEIRTLMTEKIVGEISLAQIQSAMEAERSSPSHTVTLLESGPTSQYTALDHDGFIGRLVVVEFVVDKLNPGVKTGMNTYPVPQLVLTKEFLDSASQSFIDQIKASSGTPGSFHEVGGWIAHTENGTYTSRAVTSNDPFAIENGIILDAFQDLYQQAQQQEGQGVKFTDIELFHTHLERGEAFSFNDLGFQEKYFHRFKKLLTSGGTFVSYAVPIQGRVLFRSSMQNTGY